MKISLNVTNFSWPAGTADLASVARAADEGGLDTLWVSDHLIQRDPGAAAGERDMLEAYTTLGYLAAVTRQIKLGTMVTAATYREPALLVKAVTTLDALSGGRAWLGIGAGYPGEAERLGLPSPSGAERFTRLADVLGLAAHMWAQRPGPFTGRLVTVPHPECVPAPVRADGIPILIGGAGERRTLRLVAEFGDACNLFDIPDDGATVRRKLDVLRDHCADLGRDDATIEKTVSTRLDPDETAAAFATRCSRLREWGLSHVVVITPGPWTGERLDPLLAAAAHVQDL